MMQLILQSLHADQAVLHSIAKLAGAHQISMTGSHLLQCSEFRRTEPLAQIQAEVAALAWQEQVDVHWKGSTQQLQDFRLLAMDMDSTLITIECIDEIADMHGLKSEVAAITEAAMRGELAFTESLTRRVALLKDLPVSALQQVYEERLKFSPGAEKLLHTAQEAGLATLLVSGGFTFFTDRVRDRLHLSFSHANALDIQDGKLTGRVNGTIVDGAEKRRMVEQTCATLGISTDQVIAIGDGANDLDMMSVVGLSVAYRAKPIVRSQADVALNFVGLDGLLNIL